MLCLHALLTPAAIAGCLNTDSVRRHLRSAKLKGNTTTTVTGSVKAVCDSHEQPTVGAVDPNEKVVVAKRFIQPGQGLVYSIHFENIESAEARDVFITDILYSNLDISTLELLTPGGSVDLPTRTVKWVCEQKS